MKRATLDGMMRLVNFHLGGSLYTVPAVALAGGTLQMVLLLGACALLTQLVYENLADVAVKRQTGSLCRIVSSVLGRGAALFLRVLIVLNALGVVVAYIQATRDIYEGVARSSVASQPFVLFVFTVAAGCAVVPILDRVCPETADWGSLMANVALLALLGALFWLPAGGGHGGKPGGAAPLPEPRPFWDMAVSFGPSLVFAFSSAEYVLLACGVCDSNGALLRGAAVHSQVRRIGAASLVTSFSLYAAVGYGGLRAFGAGVQDDVLKNFSLEASGQQLTSALVLGTNAVSLLLSLPVFAEALLLYARELLQELLPPELFARFERHALGTWFVNPAHPYIGCAWTVPLASVLAYKATGLLSIINLMSACTDYAFMFVFPGFAFCASFPFSQYYVRWALNALLLMGALYMGHRSFMSEWRSL